MNMFNKLKAFFRLIKFEHTVFALPFAYLGMLLACGGWPRFNVFFWVTLAMASARTAGMLLNRLIDLKIDAQNPRTQNRPILTGEFSVNAAIASTAAALALFFLSAFMLNPLCFKLSFVALFLLIAYHYVKRFSFLCHFTLGLVLAVAPMGGWLGVTGTFSWPPTLLSLAVLFWVAGFDIIYSLQDVHFDKSHGLHSIPVEFGQALALKISAYCHLVTAVCLVFFGFVGHLGFIYGIGVALCAILLKLEHSLLSEEDLGRIDTSFFVINGWIGILLFVFTFLDIFR
ncbi:MAG: hypothetical protein AUJ71_04660 [Candidatus Omnitrophica bacterium CG1_02_49_16]|nr:MAG: hypothetical protein AUJ71_04660 [Candidatus Omnitrophica bacterium CG1_02_49_16]